MFNNIMVIMLSKFRSIYKALAQYCNLLNAINFSSSDSKALKCLQDKIFMHTFFSEKKKKGSWCRHLVVSEDQVLKIPNGLPVEAAATVSVNPCTAFRLLKDFEDLQPGNIK